MQTKVENYLRYWHQSLLDAEMRSPSVPNKPMHIVAEELRAGRLSEHSTRSAFADWEKESRRFSKKKSASREAASCPVLICPWRLQRRFEHGRRRGVGPPKIYAPFWISARIDRKGTLHGDGGTAWFDRQCLAPSFSDAPIFGDLKAYDDFLSRNQNPDSWESLKRFAEDLFHAVSKQSLHDLEIEEFATLDEDPILLASRPASGFAQNIFFLYEHLRRKESPKPKLLCDLARGREPRPQPPPYPECDFDLVVRHSGQMGNQFPLSPSQRTVLHSLSDLGRGELLAVTGPPGTGKTTLLQSVVASEWVVAALEEAEGPPILVACSTNNQAVTNILESMDRALEGSEAFPLARRWIPSVRSYGLCFPSAAVFDRVPYQKAMLGRSPKGLHSELENVDFVESAESAYLRAAQETFLTSRWKTVEEVVGELHRRMRESERELRDLATVGRRVLENRRHEREDLESDRNLLEQIRRLQVYDRGTDVESLLKHPEEIPAALDTTIRYRLFLLAARYWEGRWLLEMQDELQEPEGLKGQSRARCEQRFRRFAMLTPCMVVTFHRLPRIFECFDKGESSPLWKAIDLLIVDEAGQTSPEIGAPAFALAQRALVVGDVHQIEPLWGVPPTIDRANLADNEFPSGEEAPQKDRAYRASSGSLMTLARRASASTSEHEEGLLLSEHRRCVPGIIEYCNRLVYRGMLEPLRPDLEKRLLPAMGWGRIVSESRRGRSGGSRSNPGEARAIAAWLSSRRDELEAFYETETARIVGVITPFSAQKRALQRALADEGLEDVTAGTVHAFQGAERPVVVFSPVYSCEDQTTGFFFDAGRNMLNVAVSRARDSFLVFGDMELFQPDPEGLPSQVLAHFLFADPSHEITDLISPSAL